VAHLHVDSTGILNVQHEQCQPCQRAYLAYKVGLADKNKTNFKFPPGQHVNAVSSMNARVSGSCGDIQSRPWKKAAQRHHDKTPDFTCSFPVFDEMAARF
jgi:hypothetical protein